jgi:aryl-alcohol dehydrogenase-like predicted oxidoreductase
MTGGESNAASAGSFALGHWRVNRVGYGAMQLAGDNVFGPPRDRDEALRVLRAAIDSGINHIDTAQYYGPAVVNELIREALYPYPSDLAIVSKVAARRDEAGAVLAYDEPDELRAGLEENLVTLGLDPLAAVNLRLMDGSEPSERFDRLAALIEARDPVLADLGARLDATPVQIALAWLFDVAPNVLLIPGTRTRQHLRENIGSAALQLDDAARADLARHFPTLSAE